MGPRHVPEEDLERPRERATGSLFFLEPVLIDDDPRLVTSMLYLQVSVLGTARR